MSDNRTRK